MSEAAAPIQVERYAIDARGSRLTIQAFATGVLSVMGHNPVIAARDISGEIRFAPETLDSVSLTLRITTASLAVQTDVSDKDRRDIEQTMKEEVLETAKYPEIVIEGSKASIDKTSDGRLPAEVECNVTMHGVTRTQRVPGQVFMMGDTLRAQGEFQVRQTEFGITLVSVAGGALKIKDELKCSFDSACTKGDVETCAWPSPDRSSRWCPTARPARSSTSSVCGAESISDCSSTTCRRPATGSSSTSASQ